MGNARKKSIKLREFYLGGAAIALFAELGLPGASAQVAGTEPQLPEIVVTAPSPIVRPEFGSPSAGGSSEPTSQFSSPQRGVLPVVVDQFATVTVVPNEELRRNPASTLGDQLFSKPGITGSSFAPGAASRPVIRGLDVNRVGIVENGVNGGGVSDLGEDHFAPIDPLATNQVEVIRGPAALRWGSSAIGGVVSATNNRIPDALPCKSPEDAAAPRRLPGTASCVEVETRSVFSTADKGVQSGVLVDVGAGNFAFHGDAYGRRAGDYAIPGSPYLDDPAHPYGGLQPNSSSRTWGGSLGGSYIFDRGSIGASIAQNNALYDIPTREGAELRERIDANQTRFNIKGEYRPTFLAIDVIRFWAGATDYKHNELGLEEAGDRFSDAVHQRFTNKEQEARIEFQLHPFNVGSGDMVTALGLHVGHQRLTASSPEDPGSLYNGLFDPNRNRRIAAYVFNEYRFSTSTRAQFAGRLEHVNLTGATPDFPPGHLPDGLPLFAVQRDLSYTPKSGSLGLIHRLPGDVVASVTAQHIERAPKPAELFSRGVHHATGTFDIGDPNLKIETARSIEIGLRRATGPFRFEATAFHTRFNNFIYRRLTGAFCRGDFLSCHLHDRHDEDEHDHHEHDHAHEHEHEHEHGGGHSHESRLAVYSQRDATFTGGEFQAQVDVGEIYNGTYGVEGQFDVVRAKFTDGSYVPRIPPMRIGGGLFYRDANWLARINFLHAFAQKRITEVETPTDSYNLLRAELSYKTSLDPLRFGARAITIGIVGDNLLNEEIRNSVSYSKDEVLAPGRNVRIFANLKF